MSECVSGRTLGGGRDARTNVEGGRSGVSRVDEGDELVVNGLSVSTQEVSNEHQ
jgi:hypothetical protein